MSYWVRPTTADIGIRAFGKNANDLVKEMTIGMQSILLAENQDLNSITRRLRALSGILLFIYSITHLINHSLNVYSVSYTHLTLPTKRIV